MKHSFFWKLSGQEEYLLGRTVCEVSSGYELGLYVYHEGFSDGVKMSHPLSQRWYQLSQRHPSELPGRVDPENCKTQENKKSIKETARKSKKTAHQKIKENCKGTMSVAINVVMHAAPQGSILPGSALARSCTVGLC
jgi:hypothetical protein